MHKQNNSKIIKNDIESEIIAKEIGFSPYKKVNDKRCKEALDWWNLNRSKWDSIRSEWNKIYNQESDISMKKKVEGMFLYEHLMFTNSYESIETHSKLIQSFLK
mgnify:FL=1